ncbi:MAG: sensor histidine kinase [Aliihoeflea sp.]
MYQSLCARLVMPISKSAFTRLTAILLLVGLAALVAIVGTSFWLVERTQVYFEEVVEAREGRAATTDLRNAMQEIDAGQRGYLLTGEERHLNNFYAAREAIDAYFDRLAEELQPYPQATAPLEQLRAALDHKVEASSRSIELRRQGNLAEAIAIFAEGMDRDMLGEARDFMNTIIAAADDRLAEGIEDQRQTANLLRLVTVIGGIIVIAVMGISVWTALNFTRDLVAAHEEVEALNADLEERVAERTEELVRANEEIQRFAYIVTHDLRAPLVNIMGFTSELDETMRSIQKYVLAEGEPLEEHEIHEARLAASEDLPEAIGFIRSSTKKMDSLINAILKISRDGRRPLKPEKIDLKELLQATADTVNHQVSETEGEITVEADVAPIISDRLSLDQAFGNLLDNAVKYRAKDRPLHVQIKTRSLPGRRVAVDVTDNGRGIAPQDHQRVFDLFRRAGSQDQPGEGIGLAHVRTLVRGLGGDVLLASEPDKGTTFTVILPEDSRNVIRSKAS